MDEAKRTTRKRVVVMATLALLVTSYVSAQPRPNLWAKWASHDTSSFITVDHAAWSGFLERNVVKGTQGNSAGVNLVDYAAVTPLDQRLLDSYVAGLQEIVVTALNRREQQAYWINLYNALTVKVILDHYPVESIRKINISPGWFTTGPWKVALLEIEGEEVALDDIEHRILRPIWNDPRIHYAVNCASIGCPNLQPVAFTAANTEELLEHGAREYINHPRGVEIDGNTLRLSSIYQWFDEDFGGNRAGIVVHLAEFAAPELRAQLQGFNGRIQYDYDWSLNEAKR